MHASTTRSDQTYASLRLHRGLVTPSVRILYGAMEGHRPMTNADLCQASGLPRRTVYNALQALRELGVLVQRPSLQDTRKTYFWLASGPAGNLAVALAAETFRRSAPVAA